MFQKLDVQNYSLMKSQFALLDNFLTIASIFAGNTPGHVYVNETAGIQTAVSFFSHRLFLAGGGENTAVHDQLRQFLHNTVIPTTKTYGKEAVIIHPTPDWTPYLPHILADFAPIEAVRLYYRLDARQHTRQPQLPTGYELRPVDNALLADTTITNLNYVTEEMVSERPSLTDFLEKSFGFAAIHQNEVVGWCMSEYNTGSRCELGIETAEAHRRKGLALEMGTAVIQHAQKSGIHDIGWTCWQKNHPSRAAAEKLGFEYIQELPAWIILF